MSRFFEPISIEDFKAKIAELNDNDIEIFDIIKNDIKVSFDLENFYDNKQDGIGPLEIMGYNTDSNGFTYLGMCAGGDWEYPVYFIAYWDGKRIRGYVPTDGNVWNMSTKAAHDDDELFDQLNFDVKLIKQDISHRIIKRESSNVEDYLRKYGVLDGMGNMDGLFVPLSVAMLAIKQVQEGKLEYKGMSWIKDQNNEAE